MTVRFRQFHPPSRPTLRNLLLLPHRHIRLVPTSKDIAGWRERRREPARLSGPLLGEERAKRAYGHRTRVSALMAAESGPVIHGVANRERRRVLQRGILRRWIDSSNIATRSIDQWLPTESTAADRS